MTLQEILNQLLAEPQPLVLQMAERDYTPLRVSLLRKFKNYRQLCESVGMDTYKDMYIMCSYNKDKLIATFQLEHKSRARRVPKSYMIAKL